MNTADLFPILSASIYLNHAAVAPMPAPAGAALAQFAHEVTHQGGAVWPRWNRALAECRQRAARLLNAHEDELAFMSSTTHGLALFAHSVRWRPGDNVIGLADDFPANVYPWKSLAQRGVALRTVAPRPDGHYAVDDFIPLIDRRTRVLTVSAVHYASGFRLPLEDLAAVCQQHGILFCIDGIQAAGAMPLDVHALACACLSADAHKWLLGPEGFGLLYLRHDLLDQLDTSLAGWVGRERPGDYDNLDQPLVPAARRYEQGSHNMAGAIAANASLGVLLDVGLPEIWSRIEALTARLDEGARHLGFTIASPRGAGERSGIVRLRHPRIDPPLAVKQLAGRNIHLAARGAGLRVSPHFYNTPDQIDATLTALGDLLRNGVTA